MITKAIASTIVFLAISTLAGCSDNGAATAPASSSAAAGGLPGDIQKLGAEYDANMNFSCNLPPIRGTATEAFCIGQGVRTLNSLEAAADSLDASKAKGDLMLAISDWRSSHASYSQQNCASQMLPDFVPGSGMVTPEPSALCGSDLDSMARQWSTIRNALGLSD